MTVRDGMTDLTLVVGPGHTLRDAAQKMAERRVGAAVVHDPDAAGMAILTERDVLDAVAAGHDLDQEQVGDHMSEDVIFAAPDWDLSRAAEVMLRRNFRHLLVVDGGDICGVLSMRDIVRSWCRERQPA